MSDVAVTVTLPETLLTAAGVREQDLVGLIREALAVDLYRRGRLSLGKAAEVAGVATKWEMIPIFAKHEVWLDYTADDAIKDADTLREMLSR